MTAAETLQRCNRAGIRLTVSGDALDVEAPAGVLTAELRDALRAHKPILLTVLAPPRSFVTLKGGPTLPVEAIELALDLETKGIRLRVDADHQLVVDRGDPRLTDAEQAGIARWRLHLAALLTYQAPVPAWLQ